MVEVVELRQQDHEHQQDRGCKRTTKEGHCFGLIFGLAAKRPFDCIREVCFSERGAQGDNLLVHVDAGADVCLDTDNAFLVNAVDRAGARCCLERYKVGDGHKAGIGRHPQAFQFFERPVLGGETHADINRAVHVIRAVIGNRDPLGQQLHGLSQKGYVSSKARGF